MVVNAESPHPKVTHLDVYVLGPKTPSVALLTPITLGLTYDKAFSLLVHSPILGL
jgi:hypothetical protein